MDGKSCREIVVWLNDTGVPPPAEYAGLNVSAKGPYSGKWSSERVTFMLKNETYIGNMVQGRMRQINYKLKKSRKLPPDEWTVVENTHEPLVSREVFDKVQMLIESRKHTRSRTHEYLLKGLIHCHECGYPLGVIMRMLAGNTPTLYFVCRTYQRFTKPSQCTCHCIRVDTVTDAILAKIREILTLYLNRDDCAEILSQAEKEAAAERESEKSIQQTTAKIDNLSIQLDKVYSDKLAGVLDDADFQRIYHKMKRERIQLEEKIKRLESSKHISPELELDTLIERFIEESPQNRELLCSLIERIELTESKQILLYFRFQQLKMVKTS